MYSLVEGLGTDETSTDDKSIRDTLSTTVRMFKGVHSRTKPQCYTSLSCMDCNHRLLQYCQNCQAASSCNMSNVITLLSDLVHTLQNAHLQFTQIRPLPSLEQVKYSSNSIAQYVVVLS